MLDPMGLETEGLPHALAKGSEYAGSTGTTKEESVIAKRVEVIPVAPRFGRECELRLSLDQLAFS